MVSATPKRPRPKLNILSLSSCYLRNTDSGANTCSKTSVMVMASQLYPICSSFSRYPCGVRRQSVIFWVHVAVGERHRSKAIQLAYSSERACSMMGQPEGRSDMLCLGLKSNALLYRLSHAAVLSAAVRLRPWASMRRHIRVISWVFHHRSSYETPPSLCSSARQLAPRRIGPALHLS